MEKICNSAEASRSHEPLLCWHLSLFFKQINVTPAESHNFLRRKRQREEKEKKIFIFTSCRCRSRRKEYFPGREIELCRYADGVE